VTVEFWQRVDSAKAQSTFTCNANAFNAHVPWSDGRVIWDFGGRRLQYTPPVSIVGTWQHFAFVSSVVNGYMLIYRNGVLEAIEASGAGTFARGNFDLNLGNNFGGSGVNFFRGELDEFRVWNVVRSPEQIAANLNARLAGNEAGLVACYRMDEASGTALVDATTPANNGTLFNGTARIPSTVPVCGLATQELDLATLTPSTRYYSMGGYQAAGIDFNFVLPTSVTNIFLAVTNLCYDITPVAGATGVDLNRLIGQNLALDYDGGTWTNRTIGNNAAGLRVSTTGSAGTKGNNGSFGSNNGAAGNPGAKAGTSTVNSTGSISTTGSASPAILALSQGGRGGAGGNGYNNVVGDNDGGNGAVGGDAGAVLIEGGGDIVTMGTNSIGVLALSQAGQGGNGGEGSAAGEGGDGGGGGDAGTATVDGSWHIDTFGDSAYGLSARSVGGAGGGPGTGGYIDGDGGWGGGSGDGALASVFLRPGGTIDTWGKEAHGIFAQSIGGLAGSGASGDSIFSSAGGNGGSAGSGGDVLVSNEGTIHTRGQGANAIFAESVGGGGGSGGAGDGLFSGRAEAGASSAGDNGGVVIVENFGALETEGTFARGIFAQSVGGSGGNGSTAAGKFYSIGSDGGPGGDGDLVDVYNEGSIVTSGDDSVGLFAQSVGGGGGTGGGAVSAGSFAVAIGGSGAKGGDGSSVFVDTSELGTIETSGERSHGIFAQSVGGGGGNGGFAVSLAAGGAYTMAASVGGSGAEGGSASNVVVTSASDITTG
ncbi:MAG TPA: LamG domain-containing protein, partial [Verrucomicrobiae bacterium]|nr:LamG domain-containing protein [Verrucomicrobiae bacterium]